MLWHLAWKKIRKMKTAANSIRKLFPRHVEEDETNNTINIYVIKKILEDIRILEVNTKTLTF